MLCIQVYFPFFYKHKIFLPFLPVYRIFLAMKNGKLKAELNALKDADSRPKKRV